MNGAAEAGLEHLWQIVVSNRFSAYNHLPIKQPQLCWAHLIRTLSAIAERPSASAEFGSELLEPQQQLPAQPHDHVASKGPLCLAIPGAGLKAHRRGGVMPPLLPDCE